MMNIKNNIRKVLLNNLSQDTVDFVYKIYSKMRYPSQMQKICSFGEKNPDCTIYIIRPRTDGTEGLMSLFINAVHNLCFAEEHGYEAVIDFQNYHTQYSDDVGGKKNVWDFYFTQPSKCSLNEAYQSKNVILSGLEISWYKTELMKKSYDDVDLKKSHDFIFGKINFSVNVETAVTEVLDKMQIQLDKTLGLYLRGTDYIALKPSGHPIQPTVEQAIDVVNEYIAKYDIEKVFLVTEDAKIYKKIKSKYADMCVTVPGDTFVEDYKGKNYLSHDNSISELNVSPYMRGLNYLVKLIILSKCGYFVGGDTMGAWSTMLFAGGSYKKKYIFDLGTYGK